MKQIFREPLVVFLLLGGAIFILFQQVSNDYQSDNTEIIVSEGQIQFLQLSFKKVWQRAPSEKEKDVLIQNYVREEIFYREALAMGLDKGDGIIRRRLGQKMKFILEDIAALGTPDEKELQSFLEDHKEDYRQPSRITFRQVYLNTSKRGQSAKLDAINLLAKLQAREIGAEKLGDPLMLKQKFNNETEQEIERLLGSQFIELLRKLPVGGWQGPIRSGFGLHLVHIDERVDGKFAELNQIHDLVVRDWTSVKRKQINEAYYENLRKRYSVKTENYSRKDTLRDNTSPIQ